jgi:hypothetical protein
LCIGENVVEEEEGRRRAGVGLHDERLKEMGPFKRIGSHLVLVAKGLGALPHPLDAAWHIRGDHGGEVLAHLRGWASSTLGVKGVYGSSTGAYLQFLNVNPTKPPAPGDGVTERTVKSA